MWFSIFLISLALLGILLSKALVVCIDATCYEKPQDPACATFTMSEHDVSQAMVSSSDHFRDNGTDLSTERHLPG